ETLIVTSDTLTVDDPEFQAVVQQTIDELRKLEGLIDTSPAALVNYYEAKDASPEAAAQAEQLVSADRKSLLIPVAFTVELDDATERFDEFHSAITAHNGNGVR